MFQGERRILKEGAVAKAKSGRKLHMVCCNDVLLLIENHSLYRMPVPLQNISLQQGRDDVSFSVVISYARKLDTMRLRALSNRDRVDWIGVLSRAKRECIAARTAAGNKESSWNNTSSGRDSGYVPESPYSPGMYRDSSYADGYGGGGGRQRPQAQRPRRQDSRTGDGGYI